MAIVHLGGVNGPAGKVLSVTKSVHLFTGVYLIFFTDMSVEKKCVMWRNFRFLCMTDVENSEISPHVEYFKFLHMKDVKKLNFLQL